MARTVEFKIQGDFDIQNIIKNINTVSQNLNKMSLPKSLFKGLDKDAGDLIERLKKIAPQLQQSFKNPKELAALQKEIEGLIKDYSTFQSKATNFGIDISDIRRSDSSLKDLRKNVRNLKTDLDNAQKTRITFSKDFDKAAISAEKLAKLQSARTAMNKVVKSGGSEQDLRDTAAQFSVGGRSKEAIAYQNELNNLLQQEINKRNEIARILQQLSSAEGQLDKEAAGKLAEYIQQFNAATPGLEQGKEIIIGVGNAVSYTNTEFEKAIETQNEFGQLGQRLKQLTSITSVMMLTRRAIRSIYNDIKELDTAFNEISIVTGKTMDDMWNGFSQVNQIAQQYGVTTKGVVEVQNMYYHQGLNDIEVTKRTAETLTLAKIAGLDYADATDKMTAALNGFKLSADQASTVTDVTAALASSAAASSEEIMNALTKTASISGSAGTSFENTEVFLTKMLETTRESSENLGTALKTVTARFSELKSAVDEDDDGEVADFNKVDTALKSVGITIKDTAGQMRDFDDIILELSSKWNTLDRNTQRYIATQAAGSRQQSRFIALVDDYNRLLELQNVAQNAAGTGARQLARSQESLESTINKIRDALQELYTTFVQGQNIKGLLDTIKSLTNRLNELSAGGKIRAVIAAFAGARIGAKLFEKGLVTITNKIIKVGRETKNLATDSLGKLSIAYKNSGRQLDRYEKKVTKNYKTSGKLRQEINALNERKLAEAKAYQTTKRAQESENATKVIAAQQNQTAALTEEALNIQKEKNIILSGTEEASTEAVTAAKTALTTEETNLMIAEAASTATTEANTTVAALNVMSKMAQLGILEDLTDEQQVQLLGILKDTIATNTNTGASVGNTAAKNGETVATHGLAAALRTATAAAWSFISTQPELVALAIITAAIITAVTVVFKKQSKQMKENAKALEHNAEAAQNYATDVSTLRGLVTDLQRAEELEAKGVMASAEEKEELQSLLQSLQSEYPDLVQQLNDETLALKSQAEAQNAVNEAKEKALEDARGRSDKYLVAARNMSDELKEQIAYLESDEVLGRSLSEKEVARIIEIQDKGVGVNKKKTYEDYDFSEADADRIQQQFNQHWEYGPNGGMDQYGNPTYGPILVDNERTTTFKKNLNMDEIEEKAQQVLIESTILASAAAQGKSMGENLQEALATSIENQDLTGKSDKEIQELTDTTIKNFYNSLTDKEISQLENDLANAKENTRNEKGNIVQYLGLDNLDIDEATKKALGDYAQKLEDERNTAFSEIKGELGLSDGDVENLTLAQLEAFKTAYSDIEKDTTAAKELWKQSWIDVMSDLPEDLQQQFAQIDWTDTESINQFRTALIQAYGDNSDIVNRFNETVAQSGDIANKQIPDFNKLSETITKDIEKAEKRIKSLGSAIKGELDFEDMVDLVTTANSGLTFEDFEATADGFKLNASSAEKARQAMLAQIKTEYENRIADYELIKSKQELALADNKLAIAEAMVQKEATTDSAVIQQLNDTIKEGTKLSAELQQQITKSAEQIDNAKKGIEALDLAYQHLDMAGQKEIWEATQEEVKKTADKLKDVYDRLKDIYDMLADIDPNKTLKTMLEMLELEGDDLQATLDLNINPTINRKTLQQQLQNNSNQIAVQGAIANTSRQQAAEYKKIINNNPYMTINEHGVATFTDKIQELRNKAINAQNHEEFEAYKERIEQIEKTIDAYNDSRKAALEAEKAKKEAIKEAVEYYKTALNKASTLERKILDVLISNDNKELESYKITVEKKKEALQDYLDAVQDAIDKERNMRDLADAEEDLRQKERKLSILEMDTSGLYAGDIASLQKDIANDRQSLQDTYVDNYIAKQTEEIEKLTESYDRDIEAWENYLEWKQEDMRLYQEAIDSVISGGIEHITNFILENSEEVLGKTKAELEEFKFITQQDTQDEISYYQELKAGGYDPLLEALSAMSDGTETVEEATKKYTDTATTQYDKLQGSITEVTNQLSKQGIGIEGLKKAWDDAWNAANKYLAAIKDIQDVEPDWTSGGLNPTTKDTNNGTTRQGRSNEALKLLVDLGSIKDGYGDTKTYNKGDIVSASASRILEDGTIQYKIGNSRWLTIGKDVKKAYAKGGYIDYTGPAWVDGTPGNPEAILSAEDTRNFEQLRDILAVMFNGVAPGQNTANSYQGTYSIEINVGTLGEDYTIDDIVEEVENKIYEINAQRGVTRI